MEETIMCNHNSKETEVGFYNETFELKDKGELTVRVPVVSDAEKLLNHMKIVDGETRFLAREAGELSFTLEQEESFISSMSDSKDRIMLIGTMDGQIIANCSVGIVMSNMRYLHRAALGIAIQKAFWGQGIGKIMMLKCISWCKNNGVEQLELEVVTTNERAVSMYKGLGFEILGTKRHALKYADGTYADEFFMVLDLTK